MREARKLHKTMLRLSRQWNQSVKRAVEAANMAVVGESKEKHDEIRNRVVASNGRLERARIKKKAEAIKARLDMLVDPTGTKQKIDEERKAA